MVTPAKGVYDTLTLNPAGRKVGDSWDPAADEKSGDVCKAYGAPAIMRLPTRLHITWENDNTLKVETDTGTQTRRFLFGHCNTCIRGHVAGTFRRPVGVWSVGTGTAAGR